MSGSQDTIFQNIKIIYEDADYLVIDKPAGLVVHPDGRTNELALTDWIISNHPELKEVGEPLTLSTGEVVYRPGIVHRIDRETSGILVVAKTNEAFSSLKDQFKNHAIEKVYHAFLYGELLEEDGVIDRPIGRSSKDFRLWSAQRGQKGKRREAITNYAVIWRGRGLTYVEAKPKTGRTHQLRVHFKAINHPIVSDRLYAPKMPSALGFKRLALHASSIAFYGTNGDRKTFSSPLPHDFEMALKEISIPSKDL